MSDIFYVYHLKIKGMRLDEGYIGITKRPLERFAEHKKSNLNLHLRRAIDKYRDEVCFVILDAFDNLRDCLWLEYTLRPSRNIGWNIAVGGGIPPSWKGRTHSQETRILMSKVSVGKVISQTQRESTSKTLSGRKLPQGVRDRMIGRNAGVVHHNAKPCNIYTYPENNLVAENITVNGWAKENGLQQSALSLTAISDRTKPSSRDNRLHTRGLYAKYI